MKLPQHTFRVSGGDWPAMPQPHSKRDQFRLWWRKTALSAANNFLIPGLNWFLNESDNTTFSSSPPLFIIGHWRSGTTFLHSLLACDSQFGVMTNVRAFLPWCMRRGQGMASALMRPHLPSHRWDGMPLSPLSPQEEEFAMLRLFGAAAYRGWYYPGQLEAAFRKYCLLDFSCPGERDRFRDQYGQLIGRLQAACSGHRLLLKNPPNTGRIPMLLELFPHASFIYLHRQATEVYPSASRMHRAMIGRLAVEPADHIDFHSFVVDFHSAMLAKYEIDKALIPAGRLIELDYSQFVQYPLEALALIYQRLELPAFDRAVPAFQHYLLTKTIHHERSKIYVPRALVYRSHDLSAQPSH